MVKLILKNKRLKNGLYPIYLQVYLKGKRKLYSLKFYCKKEEWNATKEQFTKKHKNYKVRNQVLLMRKTKALNIIDRIEINNQALTFENFEKLYKVKQAENGKVFFFLDKLIKELQKNGQSAYAESHKDLKRALFKFSNKKSLTFEEINSAFLSRFERHLRDLGGTDGGIGVRMRTLRATYNKAIKQSQVDKQYYPFTVYKVSKLKSKKNPRAVERSVIRKIENLNFHYSHPLFHYWNYFRFSYYSQGMNFKDLMLLKWSNIKKGRLNYVRAKTGHNFSILLLKPHLEIIEFYKGYNDTSYIFPILLRDKMNAQQIHWRKTKIIAKYNAALKEMAAMIGIEENLTSYVIRHSFATNLKEIGIHTDIISETLGHQDTAITQRYLKSFEKNVIDDAVEKLL